MTAREGESVRAPHRTRSRWESEMNGDSGGDRERTSFRSHESSAATGACRLPTRRRNPARFSLTAVVLWLGVLASTACSPPAVEEVPTPELLELEGLAFVPAAACHLVPFSTDPNANCTLRIPIVIDLRELSRGRLAALYSAHAPGRAPSSSEYVWETGVALRSENTQEWPAFLTFREAEEVAGWRGMRLPSSREWLHVAVGRRGFSYPWGKDQSSVANTAEAKIRRPTPVGSFENGRSVPFGCYDMVGNVWEWVTDAVPGYLDAARDSEIPVEEVVGGDSPDRMVSVMGGSYATPRRVTFGLVRREEAPVRLALHALRKHPGSLSPEIGVRMCADAGKYLKEKSLDWGDSPIVRARLHAVGKRWSEDSIARKGLLDLLDQLEAGQGPVRALQWLREGAQGGTGSSLARERSSE